MDDAIGAGIATGAIILAGVVVVYVVGLLILAALIAAAVGGPIAGLGWLLHRALVHRYVLSGRQKARCAAAAASGAALPLLALPLDTRGDAWPVLLWAAIVLGLLAPVAYLGTTAFRQHFWPHRRAAFEHWVNKVRFGWRSGRAAWQTRALAQQVARVRGRCEDAVAARARLEALMHEMVTQGNTALLSAERLHIEARCGQASMEALEAQWAEAQRTLSAIPGADPRRPLALLRSAAMRRELIDRRAAPAAYARLSQAEQVLAQQEAQAAWLRGLRDRHARELENSRAAARALRSQRIVLN